MPPRGDAVGRAGSAREDGGPAASGSSELGGRRARRRPRRPNGTSAVGAASPRGLRSPASRARCQVTPIDPRPAVGADDGADAARCASGRGVAVGEAGRGTRRRRAPRRGRRAGARRRRLA